jgi:ornithine cyclodeaminase/thiomorpholine-carboxylate dehydrogenase
MLKRDVPKPYLISLQVLSRVDVERLLDLDDLTEALAAAFPVLSAGRASVPPRIGARTAKGRLVAMPCSLPGTALEVKVVSVFPENNTCGIPGIPSHQALIVLFDENNGTPLALMDGTYITAARTAATAALSTRALARGDARVLAILGAGVQGHAHLRALPRVREFTEIRVASRSAEHATALAGENARARVASSFEQAVRGADVVCCCTDSPEPILRFSWLKAGAHVTSVGSSTEGPELDRETLTSGRLVVESRVAFEPPPAGAPGLQGLDPSVAAELGEVLAGARPGRQRPEEITVFRSMGHAIEDAVAARLVYDRAIKQRVGEAVML